MDAKSNADKLARSWQRRADVLEDRMRKATTEATKVLFAEAQKQIREKIYDKRIPTKAEVQAERAARAAAQGREFRPRKNFSSKREGSKPAWRRTGNLRRSERWKVASAYVGIVYNDAEYAKERHERGKRGHKPTRFPAHWRDIAISKTRPLRIEIYRDALRSAISEGIIKGL